MLHDCKCKDIMIKGNDLPKSAIFQDEQYHLVLFYAVSRIAFRQKLQKYWIITI